MTGAHIRAVTSPTLAFLWQPHPPIFISISHACSCDRRAVRASPCRAPAASATQKGRSWSWVYLSADRKEGIAFPSKCGGVFLSSSLPCRFLFMVTDFHFHDATDLVIVDHPSFYPLTCSDLLLHPSQIRVCSSVYVCVFAVNGLVLAIWSGLKCANADVNRPGCAQSLLFKPQNNPHQLTPFGCYRWQNVRQAEATFFVLHALFSLQLIDCGPHAAASPNLQSAVRYRSVPLGCMSMFSFTLSSPKRWAVGMNCRMFMPAWKPCAGHMVRAYMCGGKWRKLWIYFPTRHLKPLNQCCNTVVPMDFEAETHRQRILMAACQILIHRLLVLGLWCWCGVNWSVFWLADSVLDWHEDVDCCSIYVLGHQ